MDFSNLSADEGRWSRPDDEGDHLGKVISTYMTLLQALVRFCNHLQMLGANRLHVDGPTTAYDPSQMSHYFA